jgi:hypothetical protein
MAGASVAASRPVLVKPTDQTESLALARLSARKEPHTMNDMSEDTIEVRSLMRIQIKNLPTISTPEPEKQNHMEWLWRPKMNKR